MSPRTRFGLTWWGQRWIAALEELGAVYANRLPRGRTYARNGAVDQLEVSAGEVTAAVQGRRARPYRVRLRLPTFDDATWGQILAALAARVRHAAELLDGRMPEDVDEVLAECGVSLFPTGRELSTSCSCPDSANPCKHVAAVHYLLAQAFDSDPFLLMRLRGRDRDQLLAGLRSRRSGRDIDAEVAAPEGPPRIDDLVARELFSALADAPQVVVRPQPPDDPSAFLRRLGPPPGLAAAHRPLQAAVHGAAHLAWDLLDGDGDAEPLLVALQRLAPVSARELADTLEVSIAEVRRDLGQLRAEGRLQVTGRGPATRYQLRDLE